MDETIIDSSYTPLSFTENIIEEDPFNLRINAILKIHQKSITTTNDKSEATKISDDSEASRKNEINNNINIDKTQKPYTFKAEEIFNSHNDEISKVLSGAFSNIDLNIRNSRLEDISITNHNISLGTGYSIVSVKGISSDSNETMFINKENKFYL
jgi:hypothetical protein